MLDSDEKSEQTASPRSAIATTHWSVVLLAGKEDSPQSAEALERLCRAYWYPLYVYIRRRGHGVEDAQDLTQQFFAHLLQKGGLRSANPGRGRFRTFLLHAIEHFLINEWKRAHRLKRGGGAQCLSLDADDAEQRYLQEPVATLTPERAYEKRWAMTLLEQVLTALRQEYAEAGNRRVFEELTDLLWGKDTWISYAQIGERLGMNEGAVRGAMHRLRERYRERLRAEVAHSVADPREVDDELRYLVAAVGQMD
ncbi:MAG TPA: sigma-70 family RNA polymerase sigma factor [Candidatus Paceibacterota bacterium]|nr:sigma-70 family RNA polymerase sigma factor [Verrucomicrobiota bacterium]HRZ44466.1 sigma-70 family RNA polymerase sigma factor [Candidatus Paceibacterota bacterium]HRZ55801.1 sigma-70 family RNA polymerase sigma factor [Candidatus Paceibacterota bacterium]